MFKKILATVVMLTATAVAGAALAYKTDKADCCYPGSPCCYPGSPCCDGAAPTTDAETASQDK